MDVDTLHEVNPHIRGLDHHGNLHPGGMWAHSVGHTGGYYLGAQLDAAIHYQRGMLQNLGHVWIGGLSDCYLLTGNRRTLEVAQLVADRVASEAVDTYSDHLRTVGWPLNLLVTAYELTGDDKYLAAADRQWETLQKHFDPDQGWVVMLAYGHCSQKKKSERCRGQCSYMLVLTLSSLARYHQITGDPEVLDAISVGLDQMIRESWHEEAGSFYATACTHYRNNPPPPTQQRLCWLHSLLHMKSTSKETRSTGGFFRSRFETAFWPDMTISGPATPRRKLLTRAAGFTLHPMVCGQLRIN